MRSASQILRIAYLVTDEGYPPKLLIFADTALNEDVTTETRRQALTDKINLPAN
jgi:hypothetical protein